MHFAQQPSENIPGTQWDKYHTKDNLLFMKQVNSVGCRVKGSQIDILVPLNEIPDSVVFYSPGGEYGCFSNYYPLKQTLPLNDRIKPLEQTLKNCGFNGTLACATIGFILLRVIESGDNDSNKINHDHLKTIFKVNDILLNTLRKYKDNDAINHWEDIKNVWNSNLKMIADIKISLGYPFAPEKEKIVFQRFVDEILLVKFMSNQKIQGKLLSIEGFFIEAAPIDFVYGIGKGANKVVEELKRSEAEGKWPFYDEMKNTCTDGNNLQGLALEKVRGKINDLLHKNVQNLNQNSMNHKRPHQGNSNDANNGKVEERPFKKQHLEDEISTRKKPTKDFDLRKNYNGTTEDTRYVVIKKNQPKHETEIKIFCEYKNISFTETLRQPQDLRDTLKRIRSENNDSALQPKRLCSNLRK